MPAVKEVDYPSFLSNSSANLFLSQGQAQWGGQYIPNIHSFYVAKDPAHRHFWFPPVLNVNLVPNLSNPLLSKLAVRQAIAYAIDKPKVSRLGESGYQKPANQSGVITPTYTSWFDSSLHEPSYNPGKAQQILKSAGFTKGSNGIYQFHGTPLSFTIKTISGFSDWDASLAVISQELKAAGIGVDRPGRELEPRTRPTSRAGTSSSRTPAAAAPRPRSPGPLPTTSCEGCCSAATSASTNYSRYKSAATDALFNQYSAAELRTAAPDHRQDPEGDGERHAVHSRDRRRRLVPVRHLELQPAGRPQTNPYAQPSPYQAPDLEVVLTHLQPLH